MKATDFNKGSRFNVDFKGMEFIKLEDVFKMSEDEKAISGKDTIFKVTGLFINNKSKYGARPFLATPDFLVDLPKHQLEDVKEMIADTEIINDINAGKVGFKVRTYYSEKYKKDCYSVLWVDREEGKVKDFREAESKEDLPS